MIKKEYYDVPVVLIVFKRIETTKQVFEEVRKMQPKDFYIISDAARAQRSEEVQKVIEVRKYIENHIDWECRLHKIYAEENMGCERRVTTGLTQVFQEVDRAVILEDDCVPHPDFFRYCKEMLDKYEMDERVMLISGSKLAQNYPVKEDYLFTFLAGIWGWATWRRAWEYYDYSMKIWPEFRKQRVLYQLLPVGAAQIIEGELERVYEGRINSWAYRWLLARLNQRALGIVPKHNLINNVGFSDEDATHTKGKNVVTFQVQEMAFPLKENSCVLPDCEYEKAVEKVYYRTPALKKWIYSVLPYGITRRIRRLMDYFRY